MQTPHINDVIQQSAVMADETPNLVRNLTTSAGVLLVAVAQFVSLVRDFAHAIVQYVLQSYSTFMTWIANSIKYLGENAEKLYAKPSLGQLFYDAWEFAISVAVLSITNIIQPLTAQLDRVMHSINDCTNNVWAEESVRYHCALLKQAMVEYWQDILPVAQILLILNVGLACVILIKWLDKWRRQADCVVNGMPTITIT
jgi:hypothetical protein